MWTEQIREMILNGILETLYMTVVSTLFGYVFGLPMGVLLCISDKDGDHSGLSRSGTCQYQKRSIDMSACQILHVI